MIHKKHNLIGRKFGRLTVISLNKIASSKYKKSYWECFCICGNKKIICGNSLLGGDTISCGCYRKELLDKSRLKHGKSNSRIYRIFYEMLRRCYDPKRPAYKSYGGRGITVCERWHKFENFLADMGEPPPKYQIERIDNNKGYSPDNCKWATVKEQSLNRRDNHIITYQNRSLPISEWTRILNKKHSTLSLRVKNNMPPEKIFAVANLNQFRHRDRKGKFTNCPTEVL